MSDEHRAREYPIETDGLRKGSVIDAATIEQAFGVRVGTDKFHLAMLQCQEYVERRLAERGEVVVTRQDKNDIRICTDNEAVDYTEREFRRGIRKMARHFAKQRTIDRANLTDEKLGKHDRSLEVNGRTMSAVRVARKPTALPVKRATPLPPGKTEGGGE